MGAEGRKDPSAPRTSSDDSQPVDGLRCLGGCFELRQQVAADVLELVDFTPAPDSVKSVAGIVSVGPARLEQLALGFAECSRKVVDPVDESCRPHITRERRDVVHQLRPFVHRLDEREDCSDLRVRAGCVLELVERLVDAVAERVRLAQLVQLQCDDDERGDDADEQDGREHGSSDEGAARCIPSDVILKHNICFSAITQELIYI